MRTEGTLTVVHLKDCERPLLEDARAQPLIPIRPNSRVRRYFRNEILLYKSDVFRGNLIYGAFDLCRMSIRSYRRHHGDTLQVADSGLPRSPVAPETLPPLPTSSTSTPGVLLP